MKSQSSTDSWFQWRDRVADADEDLGYPHIDALISDAKDVAKTVAECTIGPIRAFAETLPQTMAFESREWHDAQRWMRRDRTWRYIRRRWHL